MGNKKKLINKGLVELFPSNINMFIDLFAGSSIVSMNVVANKYIIYIHYLIYFPQNKSLNILKIVLTNSDWQKKEQKEINLKMNIN